MNSQSGGTLLSAMMAVAIGGGVVLMIATTLGRSFATVAVYVHKADLRDLRLYLSNATDCQATKTKFPTCTPGMDLLDRNGKSVLKGGKIGKFKLTTACKDGKLVVTFTSPRESGELFSARSPYSCVYP